MRNTPRRARTLHDSLLPPGRQTVVRRRTARLLRAGHGSTRSRWSRPRASRLWSNCAGPSRCWRRAKASLTSWTATLRSARCSRSASTTVRCLTAPHSCGASAPFNPGAPASRARAARRSPTPSSSWRTPRATASSCSTLPASSGSSPLADPRPISGSPRPQPALAAALRVRRAVAGRRARSPSRWVSVRTPSSSSSLRRATTACRSSRYRASRSA
mmetsp:Transcript_655/g.1588  ORF Transcript_655/g.1588 Transcript_655/m.1588 type:complete len:216 (+) Transcript_655:118-765(+)